jgi:hypothetical protein
VYNTGFIWSGWRCFYGESRGDDEASDGSGYQEGVCHSLDLASVNNEELRPNLDLSTRFVPVYISLSSIEGTTPVNISSKQPARKDHLIQSKHPFISSTGAY